MEYLRSLFGQKPTPSAAFRNNPANRNESQRRVASLYNSNRREREKVKALQASIMKHKPNLVQQAQAELNTQEQNGLTPIPPTPQPPAPSNRALAAAQVPLPRNQNNIVAAQRKAAREQPNIWNMNQDRSLFQLGPKRVVKSPVLSPSVLSPPVLSPPVSSSAVQPVSFVQSASRRNRRRHNTTPGLARAQLRKQEKLKARFLREEEAAALGPIPSSPLEVPVLPGRSNLGLGPPGFLGAVPTPVPPPLPPKRSYPNNQGAAAAAAFARELNEAAAATPPNVPAIPAVPKFNGSVRGTNLERANAENQPKPRKQFIVAPYQNNMSALGQLPPPPPPAGFKGAYLTSRNSNPFNPGNPVGLNPFGPGNPFALSPANTPANSNALQRVRNRGRQREENLLGAAEATRQNAQRQAAANAAANAAAAHFAKEANNAAAAAAKAAAANAAAAEAAGIAALPALSGNPYDTLKCTPCEANILAKIDTLLDRSKPSTLVSNALASGKKTIQSAIEAALLGLTAAGKAGAAGATAAGEAVMVGAIRIGKAVKAAANKVGEAATNAGSELERAARIARNCVKGAAKGTNRSQKCAAAYAAVQEALNKLMELLTAMPPIAWPSSLTFPKVKYFTLKNASGKTQFNRNVNRTRGALGRFGTRISQGLGAFGASLKNASGRASSALSRGTLSTRNYLSGRTKQRNSILRFIKRSYYNRGIKNIAPDALERWTRELVATGMSAIDARTAVINVLGGLNMGPNGKVTAADGLSLSQRAAQAEANFARAASEVAALPPGAAAQSVVNSQQAPFIKSSNRAKLENFLATEEPQTFQYKGT